MLAVASLSFGKSLRSYLAYYFVPSCHFPRPTRCSGLSCSLATWPLHMKHSVLNQNCLQMARGPFYSAKYLTATARSRLHTGILSYIAALFGPGPQTVMSGGTRFPEQLTQTSRVREVDLRALRSPQVSRGFSIEGLRLRASRPKLRAFEA